MLALRRRRSAASQLPSLVPEAPPTLGGCLHAGAGARGPPRKGGSPPGSPSPPKVGDLRRRGGSLRQRAAFGTSGNKGGGRAAGAP